MPNTTRPDFGRLGGYTLDDLKDTPTKPYNVSIVDKVLCIMGLGGCRERFTYGEAAWWTVSVSLVSSGLTASILLALNKLI